jgi:predicted Fe-Mo cluster-binding NifX family protein
MLVAIPKMKDAVAPCFEVTRSFVLARIENGEVISQRILECTGCEGFGRIQTLRDARAQVLVCNGIKAFYRDLLEALGIRVYARVSAGIDQAIAMYARSDIPGDENAENYMVRSRPLPLEDLICWTRELFSSHGYRVQDGEDLAPFPVDLVAQIECPLCHKPVRIAICCGVHSFRSSEDIRKFHQVTSTDYNTRVFVHPEEPRVKKLCDEYDIELLDPGEKFACRDYPVSDRLPVLQKPVAGHEKASGGAQGSCCSRRPPQDPTRRCE